MSLTPAEIAAEIAREGQTVILRRVVTGTAPVAVTCKAMVRGYRGNELVQGMVQGDRRVVIAAATLVAAGWPVPPKKGDQVEVAGRRLTVQEVDAVFLRDDPAKYVMQAKG